MLMSESEVTDDEGVFPDYGATWPHTTLPAAPCDGYAKPKMQLLSLGMLAFCMGTFTWCLGSMSLTSFFFVDGSLVFAWSILTDVSHILAQGKQVDVTRTSVDVYETAVGLVIQHNSHQRWACLASCIVGSTLMLIASVSLYPAIHANMEMIKFILGCGLITFGVPICILCNDIHRVHMGLNALRRVSEKPRLITYLQLVTGSGVLITLFSAPWFVSCASGAWGQAIAAVLLSGTNFAFVVLIVAHVVLQCEVLNKDLLLEEFLSTKVVQMTILFAMGMLLFCVGTATFFAGFMRATAILFALGSFIFGGSLLVDAQLILQQKKEAHALLATEESFNKSMGALLLQNASLRWFGFAMNVVGTALTGCASVFYYPGLGINEKAANFILGAGLLLFVPPITFICYDIRCIQCGVAKLQGAKKHPAPEFEYYFWLAIAFAILIFSAGCFLYIPSAKWCGTLGSILFCGGDTAATVLFIANVVMEWRKLNKEKSTGVCKPDPLIEYSTSSSQQSLQADHSHDSSMNQVEM